MLFNNLKVRGTATTPFILGGGGTLCLRLFAFTKRITETDFILFPSVSYCTKVKPAEALLFKRIQGQIYAHLLNPD